MDSPTLEGILQKFTAYCRHTAGRSREAQVGHCTCVPENRELQPNSAFVIGRSCARTHRHSHKHRPQLHVTHKQAALALARVGEEGWGGTDAAEQIA